MNHIILVNIISEKSIDLLNAKGPIITVVKSNKRYIITFEESGFTQEVTADILLRYYHGTTQIVLPNESFSDLNIYPAIMKPTLRELESFMKDERIKEVVYLASPYTDPDPKVVERRFREVSKVSAEMTAEGFITLSPITYGHTLLQFKDMPGDWEFWTSFCLSILDRCDKIIVVKMEGWDKSGGIAGELQYAKEHGIPVSYVEPEQYLER